MIPLTLRLTNFLSYKEMDEPLDLHRVHVACLSGANGNGKSALLDAVTWALWGKARGSEGGQEQERLIRDGADEARVELTFELTGQEYRVIRGRTRKGKADLHLQVRDGERWTDMAGESVTATQFAISRLLRMEYETFVASAFILQGRADAFLRMNAADRKDTLGAILGLEVYERLAERAKSHKKDHEGRANALRADAEKLEAELAEVPAQREALASAERGAGEADAERERAQRRLTAAQEQLAGARAIEATLAQIQRRRDDAARSLAREEDEIAGAHREIAAAEQASRAGDAHRELAAQRPALEERERALEEARSRVSALTEDITDLEKRIAVERKRLEGERDAAAKDAATARDDIAAVEGADALLERAREALADLDEAASERERLLEELRVLDAERAREAAAAEARREKRQELEDRAERLAEADAECPLCEQSLTHEHQVQLLEEVERLRSGLDAADGESRATVGKLEARKAAVLERGRALKARLETRDDIQRHVAALVERMARAEQARSRLAATEERIAAFTSVIAGDADSPTEREKLASMLAERAAIGYEESAQRTIRLQLEAARAAERAIQEAEQAAARLDALRARAAGATERAAAARDVVAEATREAEQARSRLGDIAALESAVTQAQTLARGAEEVVLAHRSAAIRVKERLATLETIEENARRARQEQAEARTIASRYEKLAKAFGRDGIPHKIIGNAVPELRGEANRLLGLLSDGRLTLDVELLRESRSRTVKETLDISVWSSEGKRAYEMYSGGERLRIDFALRIALSRLLARRANTRLETLVIDEGFGSQDADGRARLVEAILKVRDDFRRILVITHMDELKDLFPTRIEVEKDPVGGSKARIV